jgi:hypothetical protein
MPVSSSLSPPLAGAPERSTFRSVLGVTAEALVRFGLFTRGLVYAIPGLFALRLATRGHGEPITPMRSIEWISDQRFGRFTVVVLAVGLAGYVLWGLARAILDPLGKGNSARGIFARLGFLTSAAAYGAMLLFAIHLVFGSHSQNMNLNDWVAKVLAKPHGAWVIVIVALCWITAGGLAQIVNAIRASFVRDLDTNRMSAAERGFAMFIGRIGIGARGIVFVAIGVTLLVAAQQLSPSESPDLAGGLLWLKHEPFGQVLLLTVSIGLVVFGAFSMMCARWARVGVAPPDRFAGSLHSFSGRRPWA